MDNTDENFSYLNSLKKNGSIVDLLRHEMAAVMGADRVLRRIEKVLVHPEIMKTLTYEQLASLMNLQMKRQKEARDFIVDFFRVTSKSQEIQGILRECTSAEGDSIGTGSGDPDSAANIMEFRKSITDKMQILIEQKQREAEEAL